MFHGPVLIIDDEPVVLKTLAAVLRLKRRLEVEELASAVAALERIRATDYAVLICDANQTRLPGPSFVRAVRRFRPETPVLLMMDCGDAGTTHHVIEAGAYDVLLKPVEEKMFLLAVDRALEASRLRRQVRNQDSELLAILEEAMRDLEVLYHAYGLRGHLEAIIARAKAAARFQSIVQRNGLVAARAEKTGQQGIAPQDRTTGSPPEP
ncbi:MAG TPA: response regulator [Nitrospiraceae bacterium]|jgi:DNA-binding NtrC family response regulator|nr:response regulator [Nitrospiraceae bacterium]